MAADHVIVGAGFTGLAAARRLAELQPQARIIVIEATEVGEGSSGRNSGFASPRDLPSGPNAADQEQGQRRRYDQPSAQGKCRHRIGWEGGF